MHWYNEPDEWQSNRGVVTVTAGPKTDFWRQVENASDTGHLYWQETTGEFMASVRFTGDYKTTYDQAGLMLRVNDTLWLKCGIEFIGSVQQASAVLTRDYSDWSFMPLTQNPPSVWFRIKRLHAMVEVYLSLDGATDIMLRQAYFPPQETVMIGMMCASPQGNGFQTKFEGFRVVGI